MDDKASQEITSSVIKRPLRYENYEISKAVNSFCDAMKDRMFGKAMEGYRGWDGEYCLDRLHGELLIDAEKIDHTLKGAEKAVDVANRAMMLWYRFQQDKNIKEDI
jgi:hypothetical protein